MKFGRSWLAATSARASFEEVMCVPISVAEPSAPLSPNGHPRQIPATAKKPTEAEHLCCPTEKRRWGARLTKHPAAPQPSNTASIFPFSV